jgi:orotate phosphoribosyltransferase
MQCALFLAHPDRAELAGRQLGEVLKAAGIGPELIVAPALGGLIIGHEVARALDVPFIFTERKDGEMTLRRGFMVAPKQRIVVVEDVVTTGRSTREVLSILADAGAELLGVASLVNRSGLDNPFAPVPYHALLSVELPAWPAADCPLCRQGLPVARPGSRPLATGQG